MLDKRTSALLNKINELCSEGSFKVVEEEELLSCFPPKAETDKEGLRQILSYRREHKYIDIQYADEGMYCLCPLPEGRMYFENARQVKSDSFRRRRDIVLMTALGAFVGAFVGSVAVWLLITYLF